jgi:hypothetical protein
MTKILIDELKRIRSIIYNAAGQSPDDEESLTEAYKSINRLIEHHAPVQEPDSIKSVTQKPGINMPALHSDKMDDAIG